MELLEKTEQVVRLAHRAPMAHQAPMEQVVLQVHQAPMEQVDRLAHQAPMEQAVRLVKMVYRWVKIIFSILLYHLI